MSRLLVLKRNIPSAVTRDRRDRRIMQQIFEEYGISIVMIMVGSAVLMGLTGVMKFLGV